MTTVPSRRKTTVLGLLLFLAVLGLFLPELRNGFVNYDDPEYVTSNALVQEGLTWDGVRWAFSTSHEGYWHPLAYLSHMANCQIYGLRPWGHHLTSVLLHAVNTLLLFLFLRRMTGATWRSLAVAALFGLHPAHVESVAWAAEQKDVLSTLFLLLTLWAYVKWTGGEGMQGRGDRRFYALALAFFALGLMTKPMLVSLPFGLLILDYWPLNRFQSPAGSRPWRAAARLLAEKIPFLVLAAASSVVTVIGQSQGGPVGDLIGIPLGVRIENALISYCRYLGEIFYPVKLAVFYPYRQDWPLSEVVGAAALLVGITVLAVGLRRRQRWLPAGWTWFLVTLAPVIGLVQTGSQSIADRYTYVASIGVFVILVWGAHELTLRLRNRFSILCAVAGGILTVCALLTSRQISYWSDSESLFRHALAVTKENWLAHENLGDALLEKGDVPAAIAECTKALIFNPGNPRAHAILAGALMRMDRGPEAIDQYLEAARLAPADADIQNNLGMAMAGAGRLPEAISHYEAALRIDPGLGETRNNLGIALAQSGRSAEAIREFQEAVRLNPGLCAAHNDLGIALANAGRMAEARVQFEEALRIDPGNAEVRANMARINGNQ